MTQTCPNKKGGVRQKIQKLISGGDYYLELESNCEQEYLEQILVTIKKLLILHIVAFRPGLSKWKVKCSLHSENIF